MRRLFVTACFVIATAAIPLRALCEPQLVPLDFSFETLSLTEEGSAVPIVSTDAKRAEVTVSFDRGGISGAVTLSIDVQEGGAVAEIRGAVENIERPTSTSLGWDWNLVGTWSVPETGESIVTTLCDVAFLHSDLPPGIVLSSSASFRGVSLVRRAPVSDALFCQLYLSPEPFNSHRIVIAGDEIDGSLVVNMRLNLGSLLEPGQFATAVQFRWRRPARPAQCTVGDVSGDGLVDSIDARLIQRHAVGLVPKEALVCAPAPQ